MKVLHVLPSVSLKLGGPTQVALNLVKNLRELGVEAEIATTDDDNGEILSEEKKSSDYRGVPVRFFPVSVFRFRQFIISWQLVKWLWSNCKKYDLLDIHYFFTFSATAASIIARVKGVPYSVRPMGQLTEWSFNYRKFKKRIYWFLFDSQMLKKAAMAQCTSKDEVADVRRILREYIPCPLLTLAANEPPAIKNASAILKSKFNIPSSSVVILFMSRLHEKKRPDHLIKVFQKIADSQSAHLILAGTGSSIYIDRLKKMASQCHLDSRITFAGFVYGEDKSLLLQGSDIFVLPSYSENFGIVIAEALMCGLPTIVTKHVQIAQDIEDANAGIVVDSGEESLIDALVQLISSQEKRKLLGDNAKLLAKDKYTWDKAAGQLRDVYSSLFLPPEHDLRKL